MSLVEDLDHADNACVAAWDALRGPIVLPETRSHVLLSYASIALEHQEAIILLARNGLPGSALALVRCIFEILYKAAWTSSCATPEQVEKIKAGKFDFPPMGKMVEAIDNANGLDFFRNFKSLSWKDQNDFTHTGGRQIRSRLNRDDLQADYPDDMIAAQVNAATIAAVWVVVLLLKKHHRQEDGERLEAAIVRFSKATRATLLEAPSSPSA